MRKAAFIDPANRIRDALDAEEGATINRAAIHALQQYRSLALGRRTYRVPLIPYTVGQQVGELLHRQRRFSLSGKLHPRPSDDEPAALERWLRRDEALTREWADWCRDVIRVCGPWLWPTYGFARWAHKGLRALGLTTLFPNPLRDEPEGVLIAVLGFFQQCRTSGHGRRLRLGSTGADSST